MSTNRPTQGSAMSAADALIVLVDADSALTQGLAFHGSQIPATPYHGMYAVHMTLAQEAVRSVITALRAQIATGGGLNLDPEVHAAQAELAQLQAVVADVIGCGNVECSACRAALEAALGRAAATGEPASGDGADTAGTRVGGARR